MSGEVVAVLVGGVTVAALYLLVFGASASYSRNDPHGDGDRDDSGVLDSGPRWNAGLTVALLTGAAGVLLQNPAIFLSSVVGFAYAAYQYGSRSPDLDVSVTRTVDDHTPVPSSDVNVSVTVTNESERTLADLRVVDGVPDQLEVASGSPRHATSLRPGESETFDYALTARRGEHRFGKTTLVAKNLSGASEQRDERDARDTDMDIEHSTITCETRAEEVPLPSRTSSYPGHITTDSGGEGVEFYATREYRPGDPLSRVDWKRVARTGEMTTVEFRETRAATVVVVVDVRTLAHVTRKDGEPDAVELGAYAAERLSDALLQQNNRVGLALFGPTEEYLEPSGGTEQAARIRAMLRETPEPREQSVGLFSDRRRTRANRQRFETLRKRLPDAAQIVYLSPMLDEGAVDMVERFEAYGHPVTVVSPNVTGDTTGGTVERLDREERLSAVRGGGVRTIDWSPDEPIRTAIAAATAGWSQ
ncbi:DUF58 domain-containing protein [Halorussus halophilus]|uniref:DUF58 domain-containing protein n=1 Tax=Halorussus halophilus TaxID=2650975 RepID=UPI001300DE3B|nr:DUF58 domain-containing protein [Halorussus halophilus]